MIFYSEENFIDDDSSIKLINLISKKNLKPNYTNFERSSIGYEFDLTNSQNKILSEIKLKIIDLINLLYKEKVFCNNCWISISPPETKVIRHNHKDNDDIKYSSIIYLKVPKKSGILKIETIKLNPKNRLFLLFNSECNHEVDVNKSSDDRICLALDFSITKQQLK